MYCLVCWGIWNTIVEPYYKFKIENMKHSTLSSSPNSGNTLVGGSYLFDRSKLENVIVKPPYYAIGIDTYTKDKLAYCLSRKVDDVVEILLAKTMRDEKEFEQEVENLAKYFNADIFRSVD